MSRPLVTDRYVPPAGAKQRKERELQLILQYLNENGFATTAATLERESGSEYMASFFEKANMLQTTIDLLDESLLRTNPTSDDNTEQPLVRTADEQDRPKPAKECLRSMSDVHKANVISLCFLPDPNTELFVSGSADRSVKLVNFNTEEVVKDMMGVFSAPVLNVDVHPTMHNIVAVSCMNGTHYVVDTNKVSALVQKLQDHKKYVTRVKWAPSGNHLLTASHDNTARLYRFHAEAENPLEFIKEFPFNNNVEAVEWIKQTDTFVASIREDNYLHVFDLSTLKESGKYNMNATGDDHVSFTAMDITSSDDGKHLLVSTDRHRSILFRSQTSSQVRNFYGATNDGYSNPRNCFSLTGDYVYCTSQDENSIFSWDVGTQKILNKLTGHTKVVRDLTRHPGKELLLSGGFDQSVRVWE